MTLELYLKPLGGVHLIEYSGDEIFMMGWDGEAPQPISLYADSDFSGYTQGQQVSRPFRLIPDDVPGTDISISSILAACSDHDTLHVCSRRSMGQYIEMFRLL